MGLEGEQRKQKRSRKAWVPDDSLFPSSSRLTSIALATCLVNPVVRVRFIHQNVDIKKFHLFKLSENKK